MFYTSISIILKKNYRRNETFITFYILAWLPISLVSIYVALALIGILPLKDYTFKLINIAGIIEGIFISLALLGDRINLLRKGKEKAERRNLMLIKERNAYLEKKINQHTQELQKANQALKASNDFKSKLLSIIAHDLRSPLSSLSMVLQLSTRIEPQRLPELLENIRKSTERVQTTLDNLLNWSISQMNMQYYEPCIITMHTFLNEHLEIYIDLANKKEIKHSLDCPENVEVFADKNQLSIIIRNLIDNAIKFTPKGGEIKINAELQDNTLKLHISNSGKAISQETIHKILHNNTSLGGSYGTSNEKGTGLGLQLCKEFIKNMNGELQIKGIEEEEKSNTVFSFPIPLYHPN